MKLTSIPPPSIFCKKAHCLTPMKLLYINVKSMFYQDNSAKIDNKGKVGVLSNVRTVNCFLRIFYLFIRRKETAEKNA